MPSVSKSQQRLMGVAYAVKSGDMEISDVDPAYRDKVKSMVDGMTKKSLKKYASTKHDDLPETVEESSFEVGAGRITPSANIGGMGPVVFPSDGIVGSGDVPAVADIDDDEEEAKKDKTKKKLEMENFKLFTQFNDFISEAFEEITDLTKALHFETDPKRAEEMKIELGKRQGEVVTRKQIEGGNYSLRRFRREIGYDETGEDLGVFRPGSYMAATSKLGDGPHKKAAKKVRWNQKMYNQWIEDVASNGGWEHAFDMAQNAKHERGLIDWVKKNHRGEDPMLRIQYDIEAMAESVVTEGKLKISGPAYDFWNDREVQKKLRDVKIKIVGDIGGVMTVSGNDDELQKVKDILGLNESVAPDKVSAEGRNWDVGIYNHPHFGELIAFRFMATDKMKWHLDMKVEKERQDDFYLSNMGALQGMAYFPKEKYDVKRLAKEMMKVAKKAEDKDPMNFKVKPGGFYEDKKVVLRDYVKALEAWVELRDSMGIANEKVRDYFSEWAALNEKKEDREGMMKFIKKHMSFVGTSEDFNGSEGGIHVSGEDYDDEFKGKQIYDYYSEDYKNREFGVLNSWEKELNKRGWYSEWYDAGTVMIWPL